MWPMSRKSLPKQFQPLVGDTSMFQQAVSRLKKGFDPQDLFVITGKDYVELVASQAPEIPRENIIGEPEMRDTMASVGLAVTILNQKFPNCTMAGIWSSDHLVKNEDEFIKAIKAARKVAEQNPVIVNIDVRPTFPNVHNGYTKMGKMVTTVDGFEVFEFVNQVEKPDLATAKVFFQSWNYLIHTGYFIWKTETALALYRKYDSETSAILAQIASILGDQNEDGKLAELFPRIKKISIDYGLFEKLGSGDGLVIPADLGWVDVGTWELLYEGLTAGNLENVTKGEVLLLDTKGSLIYGYDKKIVATIGLENLIIVDTPDALLVCPKDRAQDVKKLVEKLKEEGKNKYL